MEIVRAKHMGFCFGVLEAINICNSLKDKQGDKYILGMLVHNKYVMEDMKAKGFKIIDEEAILNGTDPLKEGDILVIRAHGTTKRIHEKLRQKKVKIYDATCIFVTRIKEEVDIANKDGYTVLFVGDKNHPEVKGIISYADRIEIFENLEEAEKLNIDNNKKYLLSTQTTLNKKKFEEIKKFFQNKYENIKIFDKICGATSVRQKSVEDLAPKVEIMVIVGDKKSSNTKKLYEISKKINDLTYLVENAEDLELNVFKNKKIIGITAGASTPEEVIKNIENKIRGI